MRHVVTAWEGNIASRWKTDLYTRSDPGVYTLNKCLHVKRVSLTSSEYAEGLSEWLEVHSSYTKGRTTNLAHKKMSYGEFRLGSSTTFPCLRVRDTYYPTGYYSGCPNPLRSGVPEDSSKYKETQL
jgi:hypothetical protein